MKHLLFFCFLFIVLNSCQGPVLQEDISPAESGSISRFVVYDGFMYVLNLNEIQTYDLRIANEPVLVHRLPTEYGIKSIQAYDDMLFVGGDNELYLLDVTIPSAPSLLATSVGLPLVPNAKCFPTITKNNTAYQTTKTVVNKCGEQATKNELLVYDISDRLRPVLAQSVPMNQPNGLAHNNYFLFVCDEGDDAVRIFDLALPAVLNKTPHSISIEDPQDIIISGGKMIVSTPTAFYIYSIVQIDDIRLLGQIER